MKSNFKKSLKSQTQKEFKNLHDDYTKQMFEEPMKSKSVQRRLKHQIKSPEDFGKEFEKIKITPPHCVQCGQPMLMGTQGNRFIPICDNSTCPNWGLLQVGIEKMQEVKKRG